MKTAVSLEEKVKGLIDKKLSICACNPCTCSMKKKDKYFQELKNILRLFNKKKINSLEL